MQLGLIVVIGLGAALGYVLQRGDLCFHSLWRRVTEPPRDASLLRAYLLFLLIATPLVQLLIAFEYITPYIPPFVWQANLIGGLLFGAGMVIASTCITGMFYKLGHGMVGTIFAIAGWAVGDVLTYRGPLEPLRQRLTESTIDFEGEAATLTAGGPGGFVVVAVFVLAAGIALWLARDDSSARQRNKLLGWVPLGLALAAVHVVAWLFLGDSAPNYTFGTSGVPSTLWQQVTGTAQDLGERWWWIPLGLIAIVPGAFLASHRLKNFWFRGETAGRIAQLSVGGFVMGVAAAIASGCNLGHSMVGVPLLSIGSIATTVAMAIGVAGTAKMASLFGPKVS